MSVHRWVQFNVENRLWTSGCILWSLEQSYQFFREIVLSWHTTEQGLSQNSSRGLPHFYLLLCYHSMGSRGPPVEHNSDKYQCSCKLVFRMRTKLECYLSITVFLKRGAGGSVVWSTRGLGPMASIYNSGDAVSSSGLQRYQVHVVHKHTC